LVNKEKVGLPMFLIVLLGLHFLLSFNIFACQDKDIIVLIGSAGSGKGTLAQKLTNLTQYIHINSGDLIREEIGKGGQQGTILENMIKTGEKISDEIVGEMVKSKIASLILQGKKIILDGYPSNLFQAQFLDNLFQDLHVENACFLHLSIDPQTAFDRILSRKICSLCKAIYNTKTNPSIQPDQCDFCNSSLIIRSDDNELCAQKRVVSYAQASKPVLDYYKNQHRLIEIDGNQTINQVFNAALSIFVSANVPCFYIEGATGVGKTTFLQLLGQSLDNVTTIYEPVASFTNVGGAGNLLEYYFGDPKRWAFSTTTYITLKHIKAVEEGMKNSQAAVILVDRSMYMDYYAYIKMAYSLGTISSLELALYKELFAWFAQHVQKPSGFIYLQTTPDIALERVHQRDRIGESELSMEYQKNLDHHYREWFIEKKDVPDDLAQVPVLIIDATQNFKDDSIIQQQCVNQVKAFVEQCRQGCRE